MSSSNASDNDLINGILEQVVNWVKKRPEILALALVGSYARGEATPDSDIDLMVIALDTEVFRQNHDWVHQINWESINYKIQHWNDAEYGVVWSRHIDLYNSKSNSKISTSLKNCVPGPFMHFIDMYVCMLCIDSISPKLFYLNITFIPYI